MSQHIEDPLFSGPCESINSWDTTRRTFRDATSTLQAQKNSKMTAQAKTEINDEINSVLLVKGSNQRRATIESMALSALKLGGQEDQKRSEDCVPLDVWKMLATDAQADMLRGDSVNIRLVKDNAGKIGKPVGGEMSAHHKNS